MSGLFYSLSANSKALCAQARGIETAGRNMANVNNTSYSRQRVEYGDRGSVVTTWGPESMGLEAMRITQLRDSLLDKQVLREVSLRTSFETSQAGLQNAQAALGEQISSASGTDTSTSGSNGIATSLSEFFNSFQSFAANPTDVGERQTLIQRAGILADRIRLTDSRLSQVQSDLTTEVESDTSTVNTILQNIADLNKQIANLETTNHGCALDLRDKRQAALESLAEKVSFETRPVGGETGEIQVYVHDTGGNEILLVDGRDVTNAVSFNGTTLQAGAAPVDIALTGGTIKGALDTRDGAVQTLRDNIDALASQLVTSVNAAYSPSGSDFFDSAGTTAATITLDSGLTATTLKASNGGAAGDNDIALAVAALASKTFSTAGGDDIDGTFSQHYNGAVTNLGQELSGINSRLSDQESIESLVRSQRDAVSSVSLDEEAADLLKFQRAFQASSRVVQVIDSMLDTLINGLGL